MKPNDLSRSVEANMVKRLLLASVGMNVIAALVVGFLVSRRPAIVVSTPPSSASMQRVQAVAKPFHWRELEAPDFPTYVKNLRAVGCPELTIRDIMTGELNEIYAVQGAVEATQQPGRSGNARAEGRAASMVELEKRQVLAQLLGSPGELEATMKTAIIENARSSPEPEAAPAPAPAALAETNATMIPAAFLMGNASGPTPSMQELSTTVDDPGLAPETAIQLNEMRADFAKAIEAPIHAGSGVMDAKAYYREWMKAKFASDDFFSSMHGGDALNQLQQQAYQGTAASGTRANQ